MKKRVQFLLWILNLCCKNVEYLDWSNGAVSQKHLQNHSGLSIPGAKPSGSTKIGDIQSKIAKNTVCKKYKVFLVISIAKVLYIQICILTKFTFYFLLYKLLAWEPGAAQVSHSFSRSLFRIWSLITILAIFYYKSKLRIFALFSRVPQANLETNWWRGSWVMIGNKKADITTTYSVM